MAPVAINAAIPANRKSCHVLIDAKRSATVEEVPPRITRSLEYSMSRLVYGADASSDLSLNSSPRLTSYCRADAQLRVGGPLE